MIVFSRTRVVIYNSVTMVSNLLLWYFKDGWTALIAACKEGHIEVVKELLECGAKVQLPDLVNVD